LLECQLESTITQLTYNCLGTNTAFKNKGKEEIYALAEMRAQIVSFKRKLRDSWAC